MMLSTNEAVKNTATLNSPPRLLMRILTALCILSALLLATVNAQMLNKATVIFQPNTSDAQINALLEQWQEDGVSTLMQVPFINGAVIQLPPKFDIDQLAADPLVERIEVDQKLTVQSVQASTNIRAASELEFNNRTITWKITNNSDQALSIESIELSWPAANGHLKAIKINSSRIWRGQRMPAAALIAADDPDWTNRARKIRAGASKAINFQFRNKVADGQSDYIINLYFSDGSWAGFDSSDNDNTDSSARTRSDLSVIEARISSGKDDAEEHLSDGAIFSKSATLEFTHDPEHLEQQIVGLRFRNLDIPESVTIISAYLEFTPDQANSESTSLIVQGEASDNAGAFRNADHNISHRDLTEAAVSWKNVPVWNNLDATYRTPNLASVVQEIVDREDWTPGNSMAFVISGDGLRSAQSYNASAANAPLLHIEYTPGPVFITEHPKPATGELPWGILDVYEQPYDPLLFSDVLNVEHIPESVRRALEAIRHINIAVFDTGIDRHSELSGQVSGGIDLYKFKTGIPKDKNGHGTHVAGTIVSEGQGIAPGARLYIVKVLGKKATGDSSSLIMALQWALDNEIDVVNMSLAFREPSSLVKMAVQNAYAAGLLMVAAAGNHSNWENDDEAGSGEGGAGEGGAGEGGAGEGGAGEGGAGEGGAGEGGAGEGGAVNCDEMVATVVSAAGEGGAGEGGAGEGGAGEGGAGEGGATGCSGGSTYSVMYPAAYPEVIAVAAMDAYGALAGFSNDGPEVDVLAPGVNVISTNKLNKHGLASGTSMAAPHVTGAVALMLALAQAENKILSPTDVQEILVTTASVDGIIDLTAALDAVMSLPYPIDSDPLPPLM